MCQNLHGPIFQDFFVTARQDIYAILCVLHEYEKLNDKSSDATKFGGGIILPEYSTIDSLVYLFSKIKFIYIPGVAMPIKKIRKNCCNKTH